MRIWNGGSIDRYLLWDGGELLAELDAVGNRIADYTYEPGAIDAPFAVTTDPIPSAGTQYGEIDELGNVIGTSALGSVTQSVSYDAWGTPTLSGSTANRLLWKGLMWEGGPTQLYYMRSRWYDPEAGRFVSEDPIGHAGGINLYAFGENDPINASDPTGAGRTCNLVSGQYDAGGPFKVVVVSYSYWVCVDDGDDGPGGAEPTMPTPLPSAGPGGNNPSERSRGPSCMSTSAGSLPGTNLGESGVEWYRGIYDDPTRPMFTRGAALVGGLFAALWTPTTSNATLNTLLLGEAARTLGPFPVKGLPEPLRPARETIRLDPPHHGKSWHLDGTATGVGRGGLRTQVDVAACPIPR